jgi:hypothetical protein
VGDAEQVLTERAHPVRRGHQIPEADLVRIEPGSGGTTWPDNNPCPKGAAVGPGCLTQDADSGDEWHHHTRRPAVLVTGRSMSPRTYPPKTAADWARQAERPTRPLQGPPEPSLQPPFTHSLESRHEDSIISAGLVKGRLGQKHRFFCAARFSGVDWPGFLNARLVADCEKDC